MKNIYKYLITIVTIINSSACNLYAIETNTDKSQYFNDIPTNTVIDINNNGIISFKKKIFKIKNLVITNEEINTSVKNIKNELISSTSYYTNKDGIGFLIYSLGDLKNYKGEQNKIGIKHYLVPVNKSDFMYQKTKEIINNDLYGKSFLAYADDKEYSLVYIKNVRGFSFGDYISNYVNGTLVIKNFKENRTYEYSLTLEPETIKRTNEIYLDKEGNGFYYSYDPSELKKIKNYTFDDTNLTGGCLKSKKFRQFY